MSASRPRGTTLTSLPMAGPAQKSNPRPRRKSQISVTMKPSSWQVRWLAGSLASVAPVIEEARAVAEVSWLGYAGTMDRVEQARGLLASANVVLGPMAGVAEAPFRAICKRMGAGLTYTEMVSALGLHYNPDSRMVKSLLTLAPEEIPAVVQIFGSDPEIMAEQARGLLERRGADIAMIDINMGCPVAKVVSKGHGCALMREPDLAAEITSRVVAACGVPVSVKFRAGWDEESTNAIEFARAMEDSGAAALAIHGRTREQLYDGTADWTVIAEVADAVSVPVIGSGDVLTAEAAKRMLDETGVDAVMIARGARGNPWIFREARALIDRGETLPAPSAYERIDLAREHLAATIEFGGEHAFRRMRKHIPWYTANLPGATRFRAEANGAADSAEMDALLLRYREYLTQRDTRLAARQT